MLSTRRAARIISQGASAISCGSASGEPLQIVTLAASLKCDPDLIFEYVYNNIEYEPLFGSNKGALGTLLDQRGDDIDQAQLLVALLSAAGIPSSAMSYEYGYIRVWGNEEGGAAKAPGWLGVKDDASAIGDLLANGGIPIGTVYENSDGTLDYVDVAHVWVQLQIGGITYAFDPSFKQHVVSTGLADLGTVLGYTQSQFLADAGGTTDSVSVTNLNRASIRSALVGYANNLISYVKSNNPAWTLNDVAGGKTIEYLTGSPLRQTAPPYLSPDQPSGFPQNWGGTVPNAYRTCFTISMPGVTPTSCSAPSSQTIQLYSDQTYGHRITVFSTGSNCASGGSCTPTLLIDGQPPPNGQNTGTSANLGSPWQALTIEITHPYTGELATAADQTTAPALIAGGSYLVGAGWGQVGRGMVEYHRQLLAQAIAAGGSPSSEAVLGESLAVISYTWLAEVSSAQRLADAVGPNGALTTQYHHGVGIAAQTAIQRSGKQGPYVDLPLNFVTMEPETHYAGSGIPPSVLGA
ncbi:MAG: transglutaminase domain-containing protein, partial [Bradyrhizobium sp.]